MLYLSTFHQMIQKHMDRAELTIGQIVARLADRGVMVTGREVVAWYEGKIQPDQDVSQTFGRVLGLTDAQLEKLGVAWEEVGCV